MTTTEELADLEEYESIPRRRPVSITNGGGSLYVLEVGTDRMKVGWSRSPAGRIRDHRAAAHAFGVGSGREWISPQRADNLTEHALIKFCAERATEQVAREYFVGVPFEAARQHAAELTKYTVDELHLRARLGSPNSKWGLANLAGLLVTTPAAIRGLIASGALEALEYDEIAFDELPDEWVTVKRRALLNWLDSDPDLLALPRCFEAQL